MIGHMLSFGMTAYAKNSLPCAYGYNDASVACSNGYGYGYGVVTEPTVSTTTTSTTTTSNSEPPKSSTPESSTPETNTDTGTTVVPPAEGTEEETIDNPATGCQLLKPRNLQTQHKKPKIVLRWTSAVSNCLSGTPVHYTVRILTKQGKVILVKHHITSAKYVFHDKRLKRKVQYTFLVQAVASDGTKTAWSKAKRFRP